MLRRAPLTPWGGNAVGALRRGAVHVWRVDLARFDTGTLENCLHLLDRTELDRASRYLCHRTQRQFIAGRCILRHLLGTYLGRHPSALIIGADEYGRPRLDHGKDLDFNIAHSGDWLIVACGRDVRLGVDVEQVRSNITLQPLVSQCFAPSERRAHQRAPNALAKRWLFFRHWTRKEAVLKAVGLGLRSPLHALDVSSTERLASSLELLLGESHHNARSPYLKAHGASGTWQLLDIQAPEGYCAALMVFGPVEEMQHYGWSESGYQ